MTNGTDAIFGGNGTAITRVLFYVAILFAFATRFHRWLSSGALMFVMVYTLTSAIHAILLSLHSDLGCDSDYQVIQTIVHVAGFCSMGAIFFSPRIFHSNMQYLFAVWEAVVLADHPLKMRPWNHIHTNIRHLNSAWDIQRAKYMALLLYLFLLLNYLEWPTTILLTVILSETKDLQILPESAKPFDAGQWGPWVGFALSVLIAVAYELSKQWDNQKQGDDQLPFLTGDGPDVVGTEEVGEQKKRFWGLTEVVDTVIAEWRNLQTWWHDPVEKADTDGAPLATQSQETTPEAIPLEELSPGTNRTHTHA
ncbi:hypothetical protein PG987_007230 [Apiospora arundinis]